MKLDSKTAAAALGMVLYTGCDGKKELPKLKEPAAKTITVDDSQNERIKALETKLAALVKAEELEDKADGAKFKKLEDTIAVYKKALEDMKTGGDISKKILEIAKQGDYKNADEFHFSLTKIVNLACNNKEHVQALDKAIKTLRDKVNGKHEKARSVYFKKMNDFIQANKTDKQFSFDVLDKNLPKGFHIIHPAKEEREEFLKDASDVHLVIGTTHNSEGGLKELAQNELKTVKFVKTLEAKYPGLAKHIEMNNFMETAYNYKEGPKFNAEQLINAGVPSNVILTMHAKGRGIHNAIYAETEGDYMRTLLAFIQKYTVNDLDLDSYKKYLSTFNFIDPVTQEISDDRVNLYKLELARILLLCGGTCEKDNFLRIGFSPEDKHGNKAAGSAPNLGMNFFNQIRAVNVANGIIQQSANHRTVQMYRRIDRELDQLKTPVSVSLDGLAHIAEWDGKKVVPDPRVLSTFSKSNAKKKGAKKRKVIFISALDFNKYNNEELKTLLNLDVKAK